MSIENGTCTINIPEREEWRDSDGKLHRLDGPARTITYELRYGNNIQKSITIEYYLHGLLHRLDGPASHVKIEVHESNNTYIDERFTWWFNGKIHRLDGPAYLSSKYSGYYINGIELNTIESYEEFRDLICERDKLLEIKNMVSITLETIKNSHTDTGENDDYYNIPKELVEALLEKIDS